MSIAVWVGLIALLGVDAETGVFMLLYLDLAYEKASREGRMRTLTDLQAAILEGAAKRLRPKVMTVATMFVGLIPIMWATGTGSDVWKRIAAPMVGGIFTSFVLELVVYPAIYEIWKWHFELKHACASEGFRVENQGACQGKRRETLQTCGSNIVDLSTTRPLSTSRTGTDWIASRTVRNPRLDSAGDSKPTCCAGRNRPTTNPLAHSEETVT
jgi:hypothetical protein